MINRIEPGDRQISASGWNEMRDIVNNISPGQNTVLTNSKESSLITVKNNTGMSLTPLSIVALTTPVYSRSSSTFAEKAVEYGTEMNGISPANENDNIAVLQAACKTDGFVKAIGSGYTPCFVYKDEDKTYEYAKPVASQTGYLKGTNDPTSVRIVWIASGTGKKEAVVCIDATAAKPEKEYFIINKGNDGTETPTDTPTIFTKGSLHYVKYDGEDWVPSPWNEYSGSSSDNSAFERPGGTKLVVCQEDAPNSNKEYKMPYFTPESNIGIPPKVDSYLSTIGGTKRCGVKPGEHTFTDKCFDYLITSRVNAPSTGAGGYSFVYEPVFAALVYVTGTGDNAPIKIGIGNVEMDCSVPTDYDGLSGPSYPDIYENDLIMALIDCTDYTADAIDYSKDYAEGTIMPWFRASPWSNPTYPGRGWEQHILSGGQGEITVVNIDKTSSHYDSSNDCVWVEAGTNDKIPVKEGSLCFIRKIKTNALV